MSTFVLGKRTDGQFYWKLNAANGETLCVSGGYTTKQNAINGIESCRINAPMLTLTTKLPTKRGNNLSKYHTIKGRY